MRITTRALVLVLLLGNYVVGVPAELKQHYVTDDGKLFFEEVIPISLEQIERAKRAKESLPASEDPEGNWGSVVAGFQLSIRLEKEAFTNGEPVMASILLRNASERHLKYPVFSPRDSQGMVLLWKDGQRLYGSGDQRPGASFQENLRAVRSGTIIHWPSPVGTQRKFTVDLAQLFDLTPNGQYTVQATREIPTLDKTRATNVLSGMATFTVMRAASRTNSP